MFTDKLKRYPRLLEAELAIHRADTFVDINVASGADPAQRLMAVVPGHAKDQIGKLIENAKPALQKVFAQSIDELRGLERALFEHRESVHYSQCMLDSAGPTAEAADCVSDHVDISATPEPSVLPIPDRRFARTPARRNEPAYSETAHIELDDGRFSVVVNGKCCQLRSRFMYALLKKLVQEKDRFVSHEELHDAFWQDHSAENREIKHPIHRLRTQLRKSGITEVKIEAQQGYYMLTVVDERNPPRRS